MNSFKIHTSLISHGHLSCTVYFVIKNPLLCRASVRQEHSGPVQLRRSLDLHCQFYFVAWEHSQKRIVSHPCFFVDSFLFMSSCRHPQRDLVYQLSMVCWEWAIQGSRELIFSFICNVLPLNLSVSYTQALLAWGEEISSLVRFKKKIILLLHNTFLCKDEICVTVKLKIVMQ